MKQCLLTVAVITLLVTLIGCTRSQETGDAAETSPTTPGTAVQTEDTTPQQRLQFSVVEAEDPGYTVISQEELGEKNDTEIAYGDLTEVNLTWDGETIPLAQAIREEKLTVPEIFAFARLDAQNGFCQESYTSEHGLTHFCYTYPEWELRITYDIYETPDAKQTLIDELYVYNISEGYHNVSYIYVDEGSQWGYFLDREDWGLTFEAANVTPTQITVNYTQQQSQEVGELTLDSYMLFPMDGEADPDRGPNYVVMSRMDTPGLPISLSSDGSGQFTIDWGDTAGALEPGEYYLKVSVSDNFDPAQVHPLIEKFHDKQSYHIVFTVS